MVRMMDSVFLRVPIVVIFIITVFFKSQTIVVTKFRIFVILI